jgi:N-acetylneuraminic acid mutarotase
MGMLSGSHNLHLVIVASALVLACSGNDSPTAPDDAGSPPPTSDPATVMGTWQRVANLPLPARAFAATAYRGSIYVVGGLLEEPHDDLRQAVMRYDPSEDRWEILNDLPWFSIEAGLFVVADTMFVVGGRLEVLGAYDPDADSWETRPSLPESRDEAAMGAGGGKIYVVGGKTDDGAPANDETVLVYAVDGQTWTRAAGPSSALRRSAIAAVLFDRLFVIGGFPMLSSGSVDLTAIAEVPVLDLSSDSWTTAPDLPFARFGMAVATLEGRIHVIGGSAFEDDPARSTHVVLGSERPSEISDGIYRGTVVEVFTPS